MADFIGLWTGTSTSTMNALKVKISFNVKRQGNELRGTYRCVPLNAVCCNNAQSGCWLTKSLMVLPPTRYPAARGRIRDDFAARQGLFTVYAYDDSV